MIGLLNTKLDDAELAKFEQEQALNDMKNNMEMEMERVIFCEL